MCVISAIQYAVYQHPRTQGRTHFLFGVVALSVALIALTTGWLYQATTVADFLAVMRINVSFSIFFYITMLWFFAEYAGVRPRLVLAGFSIVWGVLFLVNLSSPYTLMYSDIHGLAHPMLAWGERFTVAQATSSAWGFCTILVILLVYSFAFYTLAVRFRRDRRRTTQLMMIAVALLLITTVHGALVRMLSLTVLPIGVFGFVGMIVIMGTSLNLETEETRKKAEEALRESEQQLRLALQGGSLGIWDWNAITGQLAVNDRWLSMLGLDPSGTPPTINSWHELVHPDDMPKLDRLVEEVILNPTGINFEVEIRARHRDGRFIWILDKGAVVERASDHSPLRVVGTHMDITARKHAEENLNESAAFNAAILNSLTAQIAMLDSAGVITAVNDEYVRFAHENGGTSDRAEIIGTNYLTVCQEAIGKESAEEAEQAVLGLRAVIGGTLPVFNLEYPCHSPTERRWFRMRVTPVGNEARSVLIAHEDITLQHMLREQLIESQKLESLGRLAGGVAHDFNNLLTAILGYTELCLESLPDAAEERPFMNNVNAAAERAATLTSQLLMYARRQMVEFNIVDINSIILNLYPLLRRTVGEHYELVLALAEGDCHVSANSSQMEQVLTNLVVNARDAMPNGGRILIETSCVILDAEYADRHLGVTPGEYVMYSVSDNGIGMTREVRNHIFEPFFTTKEVGRGTGLGLATCYGIVKQSKGNIWVYSEPGSGTTFKVYLPRVHEKVQESPVQPIDILPSGTETVLVVDDEPMVRDIASRALRARGYRVLEASSGTEALHLQRESMAQIDLLITDVVMPLMGGKELAQHLRAVCPSLKVVYMSGYTQNVILQQGVLKPDVVLLVKPFVAQSLFDKVLEALARNVK